MELQDGPNAFDQAVPAYQGLEAMRTWPCRLQPKTQGGCVPVNHVMKTKDYFIRLTIKSSVSG